MMAFDLKDSSPSEFFGESEIHSFLSSDLLVIEVLLILFEKLTVNFILFGSPSHKIIVLYKVIRHLGSPFLIFVNQMQIN
jgi:hypothetical protein